MSKMAKTIESVRSWRRETKSLNPEAVLGLVPTMGALHKGHEELIARASRECDHVVVSVFVNPTQFGPNEDLEKYPRTLDKDLEICQKHGVDLVFTPAVDEIYGESSRETTFVDPPQFLIDKLCGEHRPGHFRGVATVVSKLLNIAQVERAYFGEKDYQQLIVIKQLVRDLMIPVEIVGVPIVREDDGLALSSRNMYLSQEQRIVASQLNKALARVEEEISSGDKNIEQITASVVADLETKYGFNVEYLKICHATNLSFLETAQEPYVVLIAARLGGVRLIDNLIVR